jgi:putative flippase GtrA
MTILIPAFEPDQRLIDLVHRLKRTLCFPIVIVDDGSGAPYRSIFQTVQEAGCTVLTHESNLGKGCALKTGFRYLKDIGVSDGVICADSDGQHSPEDIARVAATLRVREKEIVLGSRQFTGKVPLRSRFGNALTRAVYAMTTGVKLSDTQTGLRGYPAQLLGWLCSIPGERFEYEMNLLLEAPKAGYILHEMPIETIYLNENKSSHFRPITDSARVYLPFIKFSMSSVLSAAIDYALLFLLQALTAHLLLSVVGSRVVSALFNYSMNRKFVFTQGKETGIKTSMPRYFALATLILLFNYAGLHALFERFGLPLFLSKLVTEAAVFLFSYWAQKHLIFSKINQPHNDKQRGDTGYEW